MDKPETQQQTN